MAHLSAGTPNSASSRPSGGAPGATMQWRPGRLLAAVMVLAALFVGASFVIR